MALGANTTANSNTAVGTSAMAVNTTGTANVAVGALALEITIYRERNKRFSKYCYFTRLWC